MHPRRSTLGNYSYSLVKTNRCTLNQDWWWQTKKRTLSGAGQKPVGQKSPHHPHVQLGAKLRLVCGRSSAGNRLTSPWRVALLS
jgi:hypothetical protein